RCTVPGTASPTLVEKGTLARRSDFSIRNVSRIFACCSLDSAAGGTDLVSSFAVLGAMREFGGSEVCALPPCSAGLATDGAWAVSAGFSFVGACAVGAGLSFIGACAVGAGVSFAGACAVGAGLSFIGACAVGAG